MDSLSKLPHKDTEMSDDEKKIMDGLFGSPKNGAQNNSQVATSKSSSLKLVGYASLIFLLVANPYIDILLCKVPYCEGNNIMLLVVKTLLFAILFLAVYYFLL